MVILPASWTYLVFSFVMIVDNVQARSHLPVSDVAPRYEKGPSKINKTSENFHVEFFQYVTRPDIIVPKWEIKVSLSKRRVCLL